MSLTFPILKGMRHIVSIGMITLTLCAAFTAPMEGVAHGTAPRPATANPYRALQELDAQLLRVGQKLAAANVAYCGDVQGSVGLAMHEVSQYPDAGRRVFGFRYPVQVLAVMPNFPATTAGIRPDDAVISIDGMSAAAMLGESTKRGEQYLSLLRQTERVLDTALAEGRTVQWSLLRGEEPIIADMRPVPVCRAKWQITAGSDAEAGADGELISISVGIAILANEEGGDDALAVLAGHELAHLLLGHRTYLLGLEQQVQSARGDKARVARRTLSAAYRRAERDADLLAMWLLTNAGYDSEPGLRLFRRLGKRYPLSFSARHGSWGDRIEAMQAESALIATVPTDANGGRVPPLLIGQYELNQRREGQRNTGL